jgi:hypothetical protein
LNKASTLFHRISRLNVSSSKWLPLQRKGSRLRNHANLKRHGELQRVLEGMVHRCIDQWHLQTKQLLYQSVLHRNSNRITSPSFKPNCFPDTTGRSGMCWYVRLPPRHAMLVKQCISFCDHEMHCKDLLYTFSPVFLASESLFSCVEDYFILIMCQPWTVVRAEYQYTRWNRVVRCRHDFGLMERELLHMSSVRLRAFER